MLGKLNRYIKKDEIRSFFNSIHKNKLKMDKDLNVRPDTIQLLEENIGRTLSDINHSNIFFNPSSGIMEIKNKNKQMGPTQTQKLLHRKGNNKQNEKTTHRLGESICK